MTSSAVVGDIVAKLENPTVKWVAVGAGACGAGYLLMKVSWFRKNPLHSFDGKTGAMAKDLVNGGISSYNSFFDQADGKGVGSRILSTPEFVDKFYSLITDFYEYGWGESFHFAAREIGESFEASIIRPLGHLPSINSRPVSLPLSNPYTHKYPYFNKLQYVYK